MSLLTLTVLTGTSLLGCIAGVLGSFAVLRQRALVGDVLAHASLPGLCLAFLLTENREFSVLLTGAFAAGLMGVALMTFVCRWTRTKEDAAIGIVLSTFFGAGVVMLSVIQRLPGGGSTAGLETFIFGQAATMNWNDVKLIAGVAGFSLLVVALLYKEFKVFSFDPQFAASQGWPTLALDLTMMAMLAIITVVGLPAVGVVLMVALLITPAAAARFWTDRLGLMLVISGVIGVASAAAGTLVSSGLWLSGLFEGDATAQARGLPTGPLIVLFGAGIFVFSLLFAPQRGVIARLISELELRRKTARENLLRTLFELSEPQLPELPAIATSDVTRRRAWSPLTARWLFWRAERNGWVVRANGSVRLTQNGLREATAVTRAHRVWEWLLLEGTQLSPEQVDRAAERFEHLLSEAQIRSLGGDLAAVIAAKGDEPIPPSPHKLTEEPAGESAEERPHG